MTIILPVILTAVDPTFWYHKTAPKFSDGISKSCSSDKCNRDNFASIINEKQSNGKSRSVNKPLKRTLSIRNFLVESAHFYQIGGLHTLRIKKHIIFTSRWLSSIPCNLRSIQHSQTKKFLVNLSLGSHLAARLAKITTFSTFHFDSTNDRSLAFLISK